MSVPAHITVNNLTGTYVLNRTLSDSSQKILKMQNVAFLVRQAVQYSNISVTLQQYSTPPNSTNPSDMHLDQHQTSTGGIKNFEDRIMDWEWTVKENWIWGKVKGRSRYVSLSEIGDGWLREGWEDPSGTVVEGFVEGEGGWSAWQTWGFAVVDGERRHVRRILAKREGWKEEKCRMVYDWKAEAEVPK